MNDVFSIRLESFLSKFPFCKKYINPKWMDKIPTVKRIDLDLMDQVPYTGAYHAIWSGKDYDLKSKKFVLISSDGSELEVTPTDVQQKSDSKWWNILSWGLEVTKGKSIYETITELGCANEIVYILEITDNFGRNLNEDYKNQINYGLVLTIHKTPKNYQFQEWIDKIPLLISEEISDQIAEVDNI